MENFRKLRMMALTVVMASMLVLTGCIGSAREKDEPKVWTGLENCVLLSFDNSFGGHQWVCSNGTDTYIYKGNGIYRAGEDKNEPICETSDVVLSMAADSNRIVYGTDDNQLCEYDFTTATQTTLIEDLRVWSVVLWDENIFVCASEREGDYYIWENQALFEYVDGNLLKLVDYVTYNQNDPHHHKAIEYESNNGILYQCCRGKFISRNNSEQLGIKEYDGLDNFFVRDGSLCGFYNNQYLNETGSHEAVYPLDIYGHHIYRSEYTAMLNDKYCILEQYYHPTYGKNDSDRLHHKNHENLDRSILYYWNIDTGECTLLYDTEERDEWIVGYTDDLEYCLIMKTDGLYKVAVDGTEDDELVWSAEGWLNVAVETLDGMVYIFSDEDEVRLVGKVDIR